MSERRRTLLLTLLLGALAALLFAAPMPWGDQVAEPPLTRNSLAVQPYDPLR